jgi:hypothetical protein
MRVRIDLKTIDLVKVFNPKVNVNDLYLPVENVYETREPSIRRKSVRRGKDIYEEYDFIFYYAKKSFVNFKILSDKTTYYVIVDGVVITVPHDIELDYNFTLHEMLVKDFVNQSKHLNNLQKASMINLYLTQLHKSSKHAFKSIFVDFFTNKQFSERNVLSGGGLVRNFVCEFTYAGHRFSLYAHSSKNEVYVEYLFADFKFKRSYPASSSNIDKFILDFVNEHEYNCKTAKEAVKHLDDFILIRKMSSI